MKQSGIYKIQSVINANRCYIGSATSIKDRWWLHLKQLRNGIHHNIKLQRHYDKHGESDLQFSIITGCDKTELIKQEQYYIDAYNPYFNICKVAGNSSGRKASEQTKLKMSIRMKGNTHSKGQVSWCKGKKGIFSDEVRIKMSESMKGRIPWNKGKKGCFTDEVVRKMSLSRVGNKNGIGNTNGRKNKGVKKRPHTQEEKEAIRKRMTGRFVSKETKEKQSIAAKGKVFSETHRQNLSKAMKGRISLTKGKKRNPDDVAKSVAMKKLKREQRISV